MKKKIIGLLVVLALVVIMVGTYINDRIKADEAISDYALGYEMKLDQEGLEKGQIAPNFTLPTLAGDKLTLADLKGKKVILNFWATWCPPCKEEMPHLQNYYEEYAKKDNVEIVAVNLTYTDSTIENVGNFVDGYGLKFPVLLMEEEGVNQTYQVLTIPSTFMIDSEGRIQKHIVGPLDQEALREHVGNLD